MTDTPTIAYPRIGLLIDGDWIYDRPTLAHDPRVQRAADRHATVVLVRDAFLIAVVPTVVALILPF